MRWGVWEGTSGLWLHGGDNLELHVFLSFLFFFFFATVLFGRLAMVGKIVALVRSKALMRILFFSPSLSLSQISLSRFFLYRAKLFLKLLQAFKFEYFPLIAHGQHRL